MPQQTKLPVLCCSLDNAPWYVCDQYQPDFLARFIVTLFLQGLCPGTSRDNVGIYYYTLTVGPLNTLTSAAGVTVACFLFPGTPP